LGDIPVRIYKENAAHLQKFSDYMALLKEFDCEIPELDDSRWDQKEEEFKSKGGAEYAKRKALKKLKTHLQNDGKLLALMKKVVKKYSQKCIKVGVCLPTFGYFTDIQTAFGVAYEKCGWCALKGDDEIGIFEPPSERRNICEDSKKTKGYVPQACMKTKTFWKAAGMVPKDDKDTFAAKYKNIQQVEAIFDFSLKRWQAQTSKPKSENSAFGFSQTEMQNIKFGKLYNLWKEDEEFKDAIAQVYR